MDRGDREGAGIGRGNWVEREMNWGERVGFGKD